MLSPRYFTSRDLTTDFRSFALDVVTCGFSRDTILPPCLHVGVADSSVHSVAHFAGQLIGLGFLMVLATSILPPIDCTRRHEDYLRTNKGEQNGCRQRLEGYLSCQQRLALAVA